MSWAVHVTTGDWSSGYVLFICTGSTSQSLLFDIDVVYHHLYYAEGIYQVTANISSPVSWAILTGQIVVASPVVNMMWLMPVAHASVNSSFVAGVTMDMGTNVTLVWDFGDASASAVISKMRTGRPVFQQLRTKVISNHTAIHWINICSFPFIIFHACIFCSAPRRGDGSIAMSVRVCLSASIPAELFIRSSPNDLRMLSMAMARSCSGSVAIGFVMYSVLSMTLQPLQRVMNAAARVIMNLSCRDHVKPSLKLLYWLPVEQRIIYHLCLFMHHIHTWSWQTRQQWVVVVESW